jgi:hypothetical protein
VRYDLKFYTLFKRIPVPRQRAGFSARLASMRFFVKVVAVRQVYLRSCRFFPVYFILPILHTHLRLQVDLARRTKGRRLSRKEALSQIGEQSINNCFHISAGVSKC